MTRHLIVGAGVAGLSAAEAIRRVDPRAEVVLVSDDPDGYYSRPGLAYYLTGEMTEQGLFPLGRQEWQRLGVRLQRGRVIGIAAGDHLVTLADGTRMPYDRLLLACGASAIRLNAPGADLPGVLKLDDLQDARGFIKQARRGRTAVVVGGGITALEIVEGLSARHVRVHYLLRGERYWGNVLDEAESRLVESKLKHEGIHLHFNSELAEVVGRGGKVTAARLQGGETIACDLLAYAIGVTPRLELARQAGIACDKGILVDTHMQTNQADIYAAGDAAQVFDPTSGRAILDSLWTPAREQGYAAGLNMAGQAADYVRPVPFNVTRLAGVTTTIIGAVGGGRDSDVIGIARGDSEVWRTIPDALIAQQGFEFNRLRLMVGERHLLGAMVMGDQTLSSPLQVLIRSRADITAIRERLMQPGAPLADLLVDFWTVWRAGHAQG